MAEPVIAQKSPYAVELEAGKTYYFCTCGKSETQPFCNGAHKADAQFIPSKVTPEKTGTAYLCGCKHSKNGAYCDGTHKSL